MELIVGLGWYLIPFLVVLSILVFVHELGHYLVARYNGVGVDVFSIGFGPEVFGWNDKAGTRWKVSWFPLGGYVKMVGDADAASTPDLEALKKMNQDLRERSLFYKTVWQRIAVSIAGPLSNYLFAIVVFSILFATIGQRYTVPVIQGFQPDSVAEKAGFLVGDRIKAINGQSIDRFEDLQMIVEDHAGNTLQVVIERNGHTMTLSVVPHLSEIIDRFGTVHKVGRLGIQGSETGYVQRAWWNSWWYATEETLSLSWQTLKALGQIITGAKSADGLGGPLRIAQMSGEIAQSGLVALIWFMALLSVNLGLINLFPVPMLDGGHLLFYFLEVLRGKPISEKAQEWGFRLGFGLIIGLMLLATWNDITHIFFK
ncbi:MAG: RIP metalloprotease RseP [Alphaproteobacteria bacterium]|nr:RIP metalloprotease RseP [Alphaproteobacteria bacterium]